MLLLGGKSFTSGRAKFEDQAPGTPELTAKIFVKVKFPNLVGNGNLLAQLDSGSAYSMLEVELAQTLGVLDGDGEPARVRTPSGIVHGRLERIPLVLVADEGESLDVETTFLVSRDWTGKTFLGYTGFIDKLRIALDSPANDFYFGEVG